MKAETKLKIRDWFIITRIRILNFIKEHKYVSAGIGILLMTAIIALVVRAATNVEVKDATVNFTKTEKLVSVNGSSTDTEIPTFSEAIYTLNYYLDHGDCGNTEKVLYADEVTIKATLPEGTDTNNIKWIANEEAVSASVSDDKRTLTIVDKNVNVCSVQHQNISLQILNVGKQDIGTENERFQTVKPTITIQGGSSSTEQSFSNDSIPRITLNYDEELDLKVKLRSGIAKFENATTRNANFGILVGIDSSSEITSLKGKHLSDKIDIYLLASQEDDTGKDKQELTILTDQGTYGPYEHNKLRYFTNSNVPDLNTPASTIKCFEKSKYTSNNEILSITAPKVTLSNVPSNGTAIEYEQYPVSSKYTDDSKIKIEDEAETLCNGKTCNKSIHESGKTDIVNEIDLSLTGEYEIEYSVGNVQTSQTTMVKKIKINPVPEGRNYSLEGPLTLYVKKDDSTFSPYGLYDISNKRKATLNTDYTISYEKEDNTKVTVEEMLANKGTYTQKYTITSDGENTDSEVRERKIIVVDELPSITSDEVTVTNDSILKGDTYRDTGLKVNGEAKDCSEGNNCSFTPTTIDTSSVGEQKITYIIKNSKNVITTIVKTIVITPQYYKLSIANLISSGNITRIDGGNFYAIGSYFVTVPSIRNANDSRDFNIKLEAFADKVGKVGEAITLNRFNSTGESDSKLTNTFYVNESSTMVPVTQPIPGAEKNGLKGDYYTAAMGEEVEMHSVFEYAYDADANIDKLEVNIPVNSNLLPIGYDLSTFKYYNLTATLDGTKLTAEPKVTVSYCKTSDNEDCFEPTPENYTDSTMVIDHINITIEKNSYTDSEGEQEVTKNFEIKPGTIIELKTKYKVKTISGTSPTASDLSNLSFNGQVKFQWANAKDNNRIITIPNQTNDQKYATTPDIYITPYKARTSVGIGRNDKFNYENITIDASKNDVYTVYALPDVISPAMNVQSNIFGYSKIASMQIIFDLPEGVTYVYNKDYTAYTPTISSDGRTLTYTIQNIEPNSWIEPIYFDFSVDVTKAKSTLSSGETGFVLTTYTGNPNNMDKSISNDLSSIDYKKTTVNAIRIENTEEVSYGQYIYSNGKGVSNIDINNSFEFSTKLHNNTTSAVTDLSVITVLPYPDNVKGASYTGTYQITKLPDNAYCTSDSVGMITNGNDVGSVSWTPCSNFKTQDGTYSNITAYKVGHKDDNNNSITLPASSDIDTRSSIITVGNKPGDSYTFKSFLMYTKSDGTKSNYIGFRDITLDVVSKKITGVVWEDFDTDGIMDNDEKKISNVTLKLYDENDNLIEPTVTPNEDGVYTFSAVPEGNYYIVAEFNTDKYGVTGAPSEDFYDQTRLSAFREVKLTKEEMDSMGITNTDEVKDNTSNGLEDTPSNDGDDPEKEDTSQEEPEQMNIVKTNMITIGSETRIVRNINLGLSLRKKFQVKVNKYITRAEVTNALGVVTKKDYGNTKLAKLDVKDINNLKIKVIYTIELQNVKYYPGYVSLVTEEIPDGMSFNPEYSENKEWELTEEGTLINRTLSDVLIYENEKKYLTVAFDITRKEAGSFVNFASADELEILGGGESE